MKRLVPGSPLSFRSPGSAITCGANCGAIRIYPAAYELFRDSDEPILDIGCGVGLLAFYLRERGLLPAGPRSRSRRAQDSLQGNRIAASSITRTSIFAFRMFGNRSRFSPATLLSSMCFITCRSPAERALVASRRCVAPGGVARYSRLSAGHRPRFWMTWLAEKFAQAISWNSGHVPSFSVARAASTRAFSDHEFERESRPLWGTSPFNNHLFIFRRRAIGRRRPSRSRVSRARGDD